MVAPAVSSIVVAAAVSAVVAGVDVELTTGRALAIKAYPADSGPTKYGDMRRAVA